CPNYIVEREPLISGAKTGSQYTLTESDELFLSKHYSLVKAFSYQPEDYTNNSWLLSILKRGSHANYYVYALTTECEK
ncbi:MAG TPA: hypothetical protein VFM46_11000, partial [Pseudomonadales bacterium]|nr:hypothetical protein [Pseudomonadales bacterium]